MAVKPLARDFGLVLSVVVLLSLMSLISCSSRSFSAQESGVFAEVVGATECLDCDEKNIKHENAFKGLQIAIKCKVINKLQEPYYVTKATSELNPKGEFIVQLPDDVIGHLDDLTTQCFAQLHDASNTPCPHQSPSNIILLQSKLNSNKLTYSTSTSKLPFSSSTCSSVFLLHKFFHHHHMYKMPNPSPYPTPVYEPKPNPSPPPSPVYKPTPYPSSPPSPVYKPTPNPSPPSSPVYNKPTYVPKYPPVYKKPLPPIPEYHPHPKYQIPPSHEWPPMPPFPKYHAHPKFQLPPSPPFSSHHPHHPYFPPSKEVALPSP
ncbi:proline-rich protein 4-like [Dioscorea cayenensis subsp. rotundata]|uniref:Proline-rich protein 4-like n=1 Tax=Dioscorea cayennensis subsp. rotundata TaxID=55577 RepID=A0AB40D132_DIOCR|nr:proline-rich protein 4-like [Dioscorea cayenensis subsp. rotundata]